MVEKHKKQIQVSQAKINRKLKSLWSAKNLTADKTVFDTLISVASQPIRKEKKTKD